MPKTLAGALSGSGVTSGTDMTRDAAMPPESHFPAFLSAMRGYVVGIDDGGMTVFSCPEPNFLGYGTTEVIGKDPVALFGFDLCTVSFDAPLSGAFGAASGERIYSRIRELEPALIPSGLLAAGSRPVSRAFLLTRDEYLGTTIEKKNRLEVLNDSMAGQRSFELESANEVLSAQAKQLNQALAELEKRSKELEQRSNELRQEVGLAADFQKSLLPREYPADIPLEIGHRYLPLSNIGGDFLDMVRIDSDRFGLVIADVSGHGVAPAFITAMFKSLFTQFAKDEISPAAVLTGINREACRLIRTEHYITAFYAVFDFAAQKVTWANAGHPPQLLLKADGTMAELNAFGFFLGMFEKSEYTEGSAPFRSGDTLVLFTDGIMEAADGTGEQFGRQRIAGVIREHEFDSLDSCMNGLLESLIGFTSAVAFEDDITFICARMIENLEDAEAGG